MPKSSLPETDDKHFIRLLLRFQWFDAFKHVNGGFLAMLFFGVAVGIIALANVFLLFAVCLPNAGECPLLWTYSSFGLHSGKTGGSRYTHLRALYSGCRYCGYRIPPQ